MGTYILIDDLLKNTKDYAIRIKDDEQFIVQDGDGNTIGTLVSDTFVKEVKKLSKRFKVEITDRA